MNELPTIAQKEPFSPDAYHRLVDRLPVTMRPAFNQQLSLWEMLFPFEQNRFVAFMKGIESYSPSAWNALTAQLWTLETKMGVKDWPFSKTRDTIENASLLARSVYYVEWRNEVQKVFEDISAAARVASPANTESKRLLLMILPGYLPVDSQSIWKQWDPRGHVIKISGNSERLCELAIKGQPGMDGIATLAARQGSMDSSDLWLIDSETKLDGMLASHAPVAASSLSYATLKPFRDKFVAEVNTIPKDIQGADAVLDKVRHESWDGWGLWPAEIVNQPRLRSFIIELYLSGNGSFNFTSAFVEWAAAEALRRARPRTIIARFGMRSKPKPFTSIAIFENQQKVSTLPDVDDPVNSATDAVILARYLWLAVCRYPEQEQTLCLCVSEHLDSAYAIVPAGMSLGLNTDRPVAPEELYSWLGARFTS